MNASLIDLRHLRYFIAVAEELHFGKAASRLRIAQPPLSQQIRALERRLGLMLFARTSRKVALTEPGRLFLEQAYLVVGQAEKASATMEAVKRGDAGRLSVGVIPSAIYYLMPAILREFRAQRPGVEVRCFEMNTSEQTQALIDGRIQVGFGRQPVHAKELASEVLYRERFVAVLPAEDPRAHRPVIKLAELRADGFILIARETAPMIYDAVIASCTRAGFSPRLAQETTDIHMMLALTAAGIGVSLVPESMRSLPFPGLAYLPLGERDSEEIHVSLTWRKDQRSILVDPLLEIARRVAGAKT